MSGDSLEFIDVFYSYAQEDEIFLNMLESHLVALKRAHVIRSWHRQKIQGGTNWEQAIDEYIDRAHIILLLISADFLRSDYLYNVELQRALERRKQRKSQIIPILLRDVDLEETPLASLASLPTNGIPINRWPDPDEAFTLVSKGIRNVIQELKGVPLPVQPILSENNGVLQISPGTNKESRTTAPIQPEEISETFHFREEKAIIGIALDLSASMRKSVRNNTQGQISRLESVHRSLSDLAKTAQRSIHERDWEQSFINMFVYGFGFQTMEVCDLFSLIKAGRQIVTQDMIKHAKEEYQREKQEKFKGYTGLRGLIETMGLPQMGDIAEELIQQQAEKNIRKRLFRQWKGEIEQRAKKIGNTTLPLDEIAEWWNMNEDILGNLAGDLIYGSSTPITAALEANIHRFEQERQKLEENPKCILFIVSDGKFSRVEPSSLAILAVQLRAMGVTICSCLMTNIDSTNPRELRHDPLPEWTSATKMMFEMASRLGPDTEIERFLKKKGWQITPESKLFVQVNHSDVLKEFIRVILSELEDSDDNEEHPRGY